ncbi:Major facilitator superfamily protein [Rhynchospora pubera]|uniref:Major facilitator superfamily protein n=1 Tax=Rhynchospora pubera TaxID=906938 RepID=A0AAV8EVH4_9POAL|nr:Major facilitator superfamily protein [Rhynchospora pubera]
MSSSFLHWLSLVGTIWLQAINGPNSDFPIYSSQLKDVKHISQIQLNFLAFASDFGKLFGWLSGVAANHLPLWLVAVIGAVFSLSGYIVQYLFLENSKLECWHLFILTFLAGNGICWINTVCYLICIGNFSSDSRVAVGISTSYQGLSAKVYNVIANGVFTKTKPKAKSYLLLNAIVPMIVTIFVTPFLRVRKATKERTNSAFLFMFVITLVTGMCAVFMSIRGFSSKKRMIILGVLLVSLLLIPVGIILREIMRKILRDKKENWIHDLRIEDVESVIETKEEREDEVVVPISIPVSVQFVEQRESEEVGAMKMLKKGDFWLYFMSYMFSGTLGLVFLNNLGQIAESRGLSETSTLVSLSSSFGFFGRIISSFLDYFFIK